MDIKHFYPSINIGVLKNAFRRHIKDSNVLWLIDTILDVQDKGLPMGFYTSTWFANFLLQELDHKIKEEFGAKYYIRNVDDMEIFGCNKKKLHKIRIAIEEYLNTIGLNLNDNWQVFKYGCKAKRRHNDTYRVVRVLDFCGFRFYRDCTLLRKRIVNRLKKRISAVKKRMRQKKKPTLHQSLSIYSYLGWTKHGNCYNFYQKNIKNNLDFEILKGVIRNESKKQLQAAGSQH